MIKAQIVADSIDPRKNRLTTMLITFPRFILAELNTHRMLSKNSASSRAIPFNKMVESVQNNPFIPIAWQKEHKGMQGSEYLQIPYDQDARLLWFEARDKAILSAKDLNEYGVTKQLANRLLEPFMYHTVLISGTEFSNFFELRCPEYQPIANTTETFKSKKDAIKRFPDLKNNTELQWLQVNKGQAEIHMMALAEAMWDVMNESTTKELKVGEWHIPFENKINLTEILVGEFDTIENVVTRNKIKVATAMCARTSYTVVGDEKEFTLEQQIALHDRMVNAVPFHASPMEHCSRVMTEHEYSRYSKTYPHPDNSSIKGEAGWCKNYRGFIQYRELLENKK